jgi:fumarylacetoacetate (FAA) hydrolase
MKLVTYVPTGDTSRGAGFAGVLHGDTVLDLATLGAWAIEQGAALPEQGLPSSTLAFLQMGPDGMTGAREALAMVQQARAEDLAEVAGLEFAPGSYGLRSPIPNPPSARDFYAFEQHVKAARARRGAEMIPEWYKIPVFYFTNTSELYGTDEAVPYPRRSKEMDFELEMACVIGREGREIAADDAPAYIAGYMVMNDWSARDLWREEQMLNMGPAKGKDFALSLGPYLVTSDEMDDKRVGSGKDERYDLEMLGRINGVQISHDNAKTIYYTFPQMIERASQHVRLRPGDVFGSGTCGTGCILELGTEVHRWLEPGDVVEMEIERLGVLRNTISGERPAE